ncbi:MAG: putative ATPase [Candidatus Methanohalarchaeum thermophilum]|uniref:ATPase n=1 Tax=Methanohalarchaeum thermophilum TaxID=1903181 RepID=A0A1Q6DSL6_METT1|nr:MAG: putative ATPase [Candidatus Methanohalarchaeum thermophilum]
MNREKVLFSDKELDLNERIALAIGVAVKDDLKSYLKEKKKLFIFSVLLPVVALILTFLLYGSLGLISLVFSFFGIGGGVFLYKRFKSMNPDLEVKGIEKRFWTLYSIPTNEKSFLYDATNTLPKKEFKLRNLIEVEELKNLKKDFEENVDLPVVLSKKGNIESQYKDNLKKIRQKLDEAEFLETKLPLIERESEIENSIKDTYGKSEEKSKKLPSIEVDLSDAKKEIENIKKIEEVASDSEGNKLLEEIEEGTQSEIEKIDSTQEKSIKLLNDFVDKSSDLLTIGSYNFYCINCIAEGVDSELELMSSEEKLKWVCPTCESEFSVSNLPVPKLRIKDELVEDIWDSLWIEKEDEKRKIYENIEDQKANLSEKEFEQKQEAIRNAWNRIKDIRSKIRDLKTEAKAAEGTVDRMGELMERYDRLKKEKKERFNKEVNKEFEKIDKKTQEIIEETRNYDAKKLNQASKETEKKAKAVKKEKEKRHREKIAMLSINNKLEDRSSKAIGVTAQEISDQKKMQKKHEKRDTLLKTRGKTSRVPGVDTLLYWFGKKYRFKMKEED